MIELVLSEYVTEPRVETLVGPQVRLTMNPSQDISHALSKCRLNLIEAVEWALTSLYANDVAPHRVFVRDVDGYEVITTTDPCLNYGSNAIIRP